MKEITSANPLIKSLLTYATLPNKVDEEYQLYLMSPKRRLYGFELNGELVGCIGVEVINSIECVLKHIAVSPNHRNTGIGTKMLNNISNIFPFVTAETDKDAVGFYSKYGFKILSLGEKYPGVERFKCVYRNY
ncbi:GNAT family N-acetyltransferase [Bacillus sp. FJAT-27245]|uniref:GNAT family N-acetyltransferase n=1 Tax=Bacillus sp. FJAT-27245 TaxID=1684144 RepID=UPI0006A7C653|nr:GNAT family N-acetyltransferase [Bacillus sp. FJAT-27245]